MSESVAISATTRSALMAAASEALGRNPAATSAVRDHLDDTMLAAANVCRGTGADIPAPTVPTAAPELIHEADILVALLAHYRGEGPAGLWFTADSVAGHVTGPGINGRIVEASTHWLPTSSCGFGRVDSRMTIQTNDGAHIHAQVNGILELTPEVERLLRGGSQPTDFGDQYFFTSALMETDAARHAWVNQTLFIAEGRLLPGPTIKYCLYRLANE